MEWSNEWPTEPGIYVAYGWLTVGVGRCRLWSCNVSEKYVTCAGYIVVRSEARLVFKKIDTGTLPDPESIKPNHTTFRRKQWTVPKSGS